MSIERHAVGTKEPHQRLAAPDAHRLSAEIRRAPYAEGVELLRRPQNRLAQHVVERLVGIDHQRPWCRDLREREASSVDEVGPIALDHARARAARELNRVIARTGVEYQDRNPAREAREGTRQVALFVAGENDRGN